MKKLSIIVPVYNVRDYLSRCILSIVNQEYSNYEIIIIDDGSTDGSSNICDEFANKDERITVIHKENGGLSSARNAGIDVAKGEYIMFIDSDDWIKPGCLSQFSNLLNNEYDMIMGRAISIDCYGNKTKKLPYKISIGEYNIKKYLLKLTQNERDISFCSVFFLYRTEFIKEKSLRFFEGIIHEDELWMPLALINAKRIYISDVWFYFHYVRDGSIMHNTNYEKSAKSTLMVCKLLNNEYKNYSRLLTKSLRNRMAMLFLRAIPQLNDPKKTINEFGRFFPLQNSYSFRQIAKSVLFAIAPYSYCLLVRKKRGY